MAIAPSTAVRLLSNVPFSNDYKHTMDFANKDAQTSYFLSKVSHTFENFTYQRQERTLKVPKNIDSLYNCNYVMYRNENFTTKWFYAFITEKKYINPNTTELVLETDVFQTWMFEATLESSYVVREHQKMWNSDGSPIINTLDEGLNYGTEYDIVSINNWQPNYGLKWMVIVSKLPMHNDDKKITPAVIGGVTQPLTYYVVPFVIGKQSPVVILPTGEDVPVSPPERILEELYRDEDAVNNIVSIYITEHIGLYAEYEDGGSGSDQVSIGANGEVTSVGIGTTPTLYVLYVQSMEDFSELHQDMGNKYSGFNSVNESKLLMHPYVVTILADFKGNMREYKNEYISSSKINLTLKGSLGTSNKVSYVIDDYNINTDNENYTSQVSNDYALINNSPQDVPIVEDNLAAFLQGNRNSLQVQEDSIMLNGAMGVVGGLSGGANPLNLANTAVGAANSLLALQSINAKQKDIANRPPSIKKMGANNAYEFGNLYNGVYLIKKQIKPEYQKKLSDFFKMYGYKCSELKKPNLKSRKHFNFIQTKEARITGNIAKEDLTKMQEIYDSGITIWHTNDVGNYNLSNEYVG